MQHIGHPVPVAGLARDRLQGIQGQRTGRIGTQRRFQQIHRLLSPLQPLAHQTSRLTQARRPLFSGVGGARIAGPRRQGLRRRCHVVS